MDRILPFLQSLLHRPGRAAPAVSTLTLTLYLATLSLSFGYVDGGELAAVASTLGIPHATGYPTMTLLGYVATLLPLRDIVALNLLAAILTAAGAGVMTLLCHRVLVHTAADKMRGSEGGGNAEEVPYRALYAALAALATGLTSFWWRQGVSFEVYSFHLLMVPLVLLLFLRYVEDESAAVEPARGFTQRGTFFALALGLAFTNHLTTILLVPALGFHYFRRLGVGARAFRRLFYLLPPFVIGLLPYLWLPIRSSMNPVFNWGRPDTFERFMAHVSGKMFRGDMFAGWDVFREQSAFFLGSLPSEFAYAGLVVAAAGVVVLARRDRVMLTTTLLLFGACMIYAGGYSIVDIESYYLTAILALGLWVACGLSGLGKLLGSRTTVMCGLLTVVAAAMINFGKCDERGAAMAENMATDMLRKAPPNAIIISAQWDFWVSGSWYLQKVEGLRPDVVVLDEELMPFPWYIENLKIEHPAIMAPASREVERFLSMAERYEGGEEIDPREIKGEYVVMLNAIINAHIASRAVLVTGDIDPMIGVGYLRTPNRLALRLIPRRDYLPQEFPVYDLPPRRDRRPNPYAAMIYELYGRSLYARGLYERSHGREDLAARYFDYALSFDPAYDTTAVPDLPLNGEEQIIATQRFFSDLRARLAQVR